MSDSIRALFVIVIVGAFIVLTGTALEAEIDTLADVQGAHRGMIEAHDERLSSDALRLAELESQVASITVALETEQNKVSDSKAITAPVAVKPTYTTPKAATPVRTAPVASQGHSADTIRKVAAERGLTEQDTANLLEIARRESTVGKNPKAYEQGRENVGLFQLSSDKGTHAQRADDEWATNKAIDYIKERYGSTDAAIAHSNEKGWY